MLMRGEVGWGGSGLEGSVGRMRDQSAGIGSDQKG